MGTIQFNSAIHEACLKLQVTCLVDSCHAWHHLLFLQADSYQVFVPQEKPLSSGFTTFSVPENA